MEEDKIEWCPSQAGKITGYIPEFRETETGFWTRIPTHDSKDPVGVPSPLLFGGILNTIGLYGYPQAMALAWTYSASAASVGTHIEVRVVTYDVFYDIKARHREDLKVVENTSK